MKEQIKPAPTPRIAALITTAKASYMYILLPSSFLIPIERSTPYSHNASLMFFVVVMRSKKKAIERDISVMIAVNRVITVFAVSKLAKMSFFTNTEVKRLVS